MRLGQLSRKIAVKPTEIVSYLKNTFKHEISSHPNSKVNDEFIDPIISHFKVTETKNSISESEIIEKKENESKVEEIEIPKESTSITDEEKTLIQQEEPQLYTSVEEKTENIDKLEEKEESEKVKEKTEEFYKEEAELNVVDGIIKAPKVEVEGIKVVGKIELPEKPKNEPEELETENPDVISEEGESLDKSEVKQYKEPSPKKKTPQKKKGKRKTITYEEQKEREQLIYEKKREAAEKKRKEQKRLNYEKLMEQKAAKTKVSSKKKAKKKSQNKTTTETNKPEPKTLWGKFLRWLNT